MRRTAGFTLIESAVTLGIFAVVAGLAVGLDAHYLRDEAFRGDEDTLVMLLQHARMESMNDLDELPHGVALRPSDHPDDVVGFGGADYASSDTASREADAIADSTAVAAGSPSEIIFCPLSGAAVTAIAPGTKCDDAQNQFDGAVTLTDSTSGKTFSITVNHEGAILR
jgi:prepilin-type N-terminal cleavage/methylation domain-containing protein